MAITRWDPFRDLLALQERMNKLFEDSLSRSRAMEEGLSAGAWSPSVDIYEIADRIVLKVDLPGMKQDEIELKVENYMLTIKGERQLEKETKREDYLRIERAYGAFSRSFTLPNTVDVDRIMAEHKNGVLEVVIPKKEETKSKKIKVEIK
ncbi:MAG: Hsp20/alpha crystallin family protein [Acidobacteriota bacterium]